MLLFGSRTKRPPAAAADEAARPADDAGAPGLAGVLAGMVSSIGRDAAEVRGVMEDMRQAAALQAEAMQALVRQLADVEASQGAITRATDQSRGAMGQARDALRKVGAEVGGVVDTLREVSEAVGEITRIAMQTRLVAFNASVEAKRAGEAGRGFGVVADAVKDLANQVEVTSKAITSTVSALDARIAAFSRELQEGSGTQGGGEVHRAFGRVDGEVARIGEAAQHSMQTCAALHGRAQALEQEVQRTTGGLNVAMDCSDRFLKVSEQLIEQTASSGVETPDTRYIEAVQGGATQIAALLEGALRSSAISEAELFDERYQPVAGSSPPQHVTAFTSLAERLFPQVTEPVLGLSDQIVACVAVDRNGYCPTHNRRYCQPQRAGDTAWNSVNCRNRRTYNDRTGLAAARNRRPFLLQTYRRDAGGGNYAIMKDVSAPIVVAGRHWGALRISYKF